MKRHPGMFQKGYDPRRFDLSPLNKARTGVPVSTESKIKRSIANQDREKRMVFKEIIKWLKENIVEPELHENGNNGDMVNIWFMIMNYGYKNQVENPENIERIVKFVSYIQHYLPERFRDAELYKKKIRDQELAAEFENWFFDCKQKLQNYLAREYFAKGSMKDLEILKRRYKENWSESKVVDLTADAKLEIKIVDA